jgi:transcriptional regulator with PAS, ATPase and Fis domain
VPTHSHRPDEVPSGRRPRGERFWHAAVDAVFLLSGQRRLLYANPAWEKLTGIAFAEARGFVCRRRPKTTANEETAQVLSALAPPAEAMSGRPCRTRRRAPGRQLEWWEIDYFPWSGADGVEAILGKIRVIQESGPVHAVLPEKIVQLRQRINQAYGLENWASDEPTMRRLVTQMRLAAQTRLPALILGPPGAGKEWTARAIHQLSEQRESFFAAPDPRLPTAALAELLSSSRHWQIGTLYVKNPERLPRDAQALLLQHLQDDATPRLFAGSSANLADELSAGRLLPELHAAISALTLHVPALGERLNDLPRLVEQMLPRAVDAAATSVRGVGSAARDRLGEYAWPGNLAELYQVLVQACRRASGEQVDVDDLPFQLRTVQPPPEQPLPLDDTLAKVERRMIELALRLAQGNKTAAAELLAIWRPRLSRRLEQLGLEKGDGSATDDG